jgi:uncharacterized membrane protein
VLNVVAIIAAGLMVGSELAIAAFVHPTLDRLPDEVHLPAASALARVLGRFMPFWYILVFLLTERRRKAPEFIRGDISRRSLQAFLLH